MLALPIAAQVKVEQSWRYLVDPTPIDQLIAEYQAAEAQKIYVADENQEASKALAAGFKWSVAIIGWRSDGFRVRAGSGEIVWNDDTFGAGIVTAKHVLRSADTGEVWTRMALLLSNDLFTAIADEDNLIPIEMPANIADWEHPSLDLAVIPIEGVLLDELGGPIEPVAFYQGSLSEDDITLIGGYGSTGPIEIAGSGIVPGSVFDGFRRAARAAYAFPSLTPGKLLVKYKGNVAIPGLSGNGDSGGFACIEQGDVGGPPQLWGIIITGSGTGVNKLIGVTYLGADQQEWINSIRLAQLDLEGEGEGEGEAAIHSADQNGDGQLSLSELLRVVQIYNSIGYHCTDEVEPTEDGFLPGVDLGNQTCAPHASDYAPQDWSVSLSELLRAIQFFNTGAYHACPEAEDGYCAGAAASL